MLAMDAPPSVRPGGPMATAATASPSLCKPLGDALCERMAAAGRELGAREAPHRAALDTARQRCLALHEHVCAAVDAFHAAAAAAGAPHLRIAVGDPKLDEKRVRALEFEVRRGRYVGLVVVKGKGVVTLVGPFRRGKPEEPCRSFRFRVAEQVAEGTSQDAGVAADADAELGAALGDFLERFVQEAMTP